MTARPTHPWRVPALLVALSIIPALGGAARMHSLAS